MLLTENYFASYICIGYKRIREIDEAHKTGWDPKSDHLLRDIIYTISKLSLIQLHCFDIVLGAPQVSQNTFNNCWTGFGEEFMALFLPVDGVHIQHIE